MINYFTRNLGENPQWRQLTDETDFEEFPGHESQDMAASAPAPAHEDYDPDAVVPRNSPLLIPKKVSSRTSISPPPDIPLVQVSPPRRPGSGKTKRRPKVRPSQGDAVLIGIFDNGKHPDIATMAGQEALPSDSGDASSSRDTDSLMDESDFIADTDAVEATGVDEGPVRGSGNDSAQPGPAADLHTLAAGALEALALGHHKSPREDGRPSTRNTSEERGTEGQSGEQ